MGKLRKLFWFVFIAAMFIPGVVAQRSDRSPQVLNSAVAGAGDIISPPGDVVVGDNETLIKADATAGDMTVTLPDAATVPNVTYKVVKVDATTNTVTVVAVGGDLIAGSSQYVLKKQYDSVNATSDNTNYVAVVPMEESVNVKLFDVKGDGVTDDRAAINTAATIADGGDLVFPPGAYKVSSNITLDENVVIMQGASLDADIGVTITMSGSFSAPMTQVFNGAGEIAFSADALNNINPGWWGSGTQAFDHAIVANNLVQNIVIPLGTHSINDDVDFLQSIVEMNVGAVLNIDVGKTVSIGGPFIADNTNHFDGDGEVAFSADAVNNINPGWWGSGTQAFDHAIVANNLVQNIVIPVGTHSILTDIDFLESLVTMPPGSVLDIDPGVTVTIGGDFDATDEDHFDGAGEVDFDSNALNDINPGWWGSGMQAWDHAVSANGTVQQIAIPPGVHNITSDLDFLESLVTAPIDAILDIDPGQNVTINDDFIASTTEHFDGTGTVTFTQGSVDYVVPQWWGATGDGVTDDGPAMNEAIAGMAGSVEQIQIPPGFYKIATNVDLLDMMMNMTPGSVLDIDNGITVTMGSGTFLAGLEQHFQGSGDVIFEDDSVEYVLPQWWGAIGDDSTDNSAAFNSALASITNVGKMVIPPGIYRIDTPINAFETGFYFALDAMLTIEGSGRADTVIEYMGTSGYAIELHDGATSEADTNTRQSRASVRHLTVRAQELTSEGGAILVMGSFCRMEDLFLDVDATYGTGIKVQSRTYIATEDSFTTDISNDFTDSGGGGVSEKYAIAYTTEAGLGGALRAVTVRLGKTGAPAGTITASLYTDSAGPDTLVAGASQTISCNALSADADGADQRFVINWAEKGNVSASTKYWIVLETAGYTYADGVTEVRLRVESGGGAANSFATYDTGAWVLGTDGANYIVEFANSQALNNFATDVDIGRNTDGSHPAVGVNVAENSILYMEGCQIKAIVPIYSIGLPFLHLRQCDIDQQGGTGYVVDFENSVSSSFVALNTYFEGGNAANPIHLGKHGGTTFVGCNIRTYLAWTSGYGDIEGYGNIGPLFVTDDHTTMPSLLNRSKTFIPDTPDLIRGTELTGTVTTAVDADALTGTAWSLPAFNDKVYIKFGATGARQYYYLPPGIYLYTVYAKVTTSDGDDMSLECYYPSEIGPQMANAANFIMTSAYKPYRVIAILPESNGASLRVSGRNNTGVFVSHIQMDYIGPIEPHRSDVTVFNATGGNADGDREVSVNFTGIQSDGITQTYLATITVFHDGAGADEKGRVELRVNDGDDNFLPTLVAYWDSAGDTYLIGNFSLGGNTDNDPTITMDGDTTDGVINYNEDDGIFEFDQDVNIDGNLTSDEMNDGYSNIMAGIILSQATTPPLLLTWITPATTEVDLTGNGNDATYNNFVTGDQIYKGKVYALTFYADNDEYLIVGDDPAFSRDDTGDNPSSMCAWIEVINTNDYQTIIAKYDHGGTDREWWFWLNNFEDIIALFYDEADDKFIQNYSDDPISVGWHFVVHTYNSTGGAAAFSDVNSIWYVDGVAIAESQTNDADYTGMVVGATDVTIGARADPDNYFQGDIGAVWLEDVELTPEQVWLYYITTRGFYHE